MEEDNSMKQMYVFDIEKIAEFVFSKKDKLNKDTEILEKFEKNENGDLILTSKEIKEIKKTSDVGIDTIKYDLIKMFIQTLIEMPNSDSIDDETTFGEKVIVNTMVNEEFLKLVNTNNE